MSKVLSFNKIKQGLEKVKNLGHATDEFTVAGKKFRIRTISRPELSLAQAYARPYFEEAKEGEDSLLMGDWLQATKHGALSFSIEAIEDLDFTGVEFIEMEDGKKVQKHVFVRELLQGWEESLVNILYRKLSDLTEKAEEESKKGVTFLEKDPESELLELEAKVSSLRSELGLPQLVPGGSQLPAPSKPVEDMEPGELRDMVFAPVNDGEMEEQPAPEALEPVPEPEPTPAPYTEEEARLAQEHERLLEERRAAQRRKEALGRQPLNQDHVVVNQGGKVPRDEHGNPLPYEGSSTGVEVLGAGPRDRVDPAPQFQANTRPKGNANPRFYNPRNPHSK